MAAPSIITAMDDPELFGPFFRGLTWTAWRVFLAALFALPMDEAALTAYRHHTGRQEAPTAAFKEAVLVCGRRGGKSRTLALIAVFLACFLDYTPYLAPGEVATVAVIAADRRQARSIFRFIGGMLNEVALLAPMVTAQTADSITLSNGVVIEIHTASFRVTRGYSLAAALCDEVAFWRSEDSANPDEEILSALRPGLSNIPASMLLIASSPYSRRGALWKSFKTYWAREGGRVLVWRGTTAEMNPTIDPAIIAGAYEEDPANAAAEFGAEFRNDIGAFVAREVIEGVTVPGRFELPPMPTTSYFAFVDPSGGSSDSMTLAIAHHDHDRAVLDAVREAKPPFSPEGVVAEFSGLLRRYRLSEVTGDRYAGEWPRERFKFHKIEYRISERAKGDIYRDILPELNSGRVELLDHAKMAAQFCGLERRVARGGKDSIDHPPGAHDDIANATAGALLMAGGGYGPIKISDEALNRARRSSAHSLILDF